MRMALAVAALTAALLGTSAADAAATIWQTQGSIAAGVGGCGFSATCLAFTYPAYAGQSCAEPLARSDGADISIVAVPAEAWGYSGVFTWEAAVPPNSLRTAPVTVDFLGGSRGCTDAVGTTQNVTGPSGYVSVPPGARWAVIGTQQAVSFTWTFVVSR